MSHNRDSETLLDIERAAQKIIKFKQALERESITLIRLL
jgi:hypothetical protein